MPHHRHIVLSLCLAMLTAVCPESGHNRKYCRLTKAGYHCLTDKVNNPEFGVEPAHQASSDKHGATLWRKQIQGGAQASSEKHGATLWKKQTQGGALGKKGANGDKLESIFFVKHSQGRKKGKPVRKLVYRNKGALYKHRDNKRKGSGWRKKSVLNQVKSDRDTGKKTPGKRLLPGDGGLVSKVFSAVATTLAMGLAVGVVNNAKQTEGDDRIFRGLEVEPHSWPWIAKIKTFFQRGGSSRRDFRRSCGGALITERFVLTARHCVSWEDGEVVNGRYVTVWLGSHARMGLDGVKMEVKRVIARRDYQKPTCAPGMWCPAWAFWSHRTLTNDIALLELKYPAPRSPKIQAIRLAQENYAAGTQGFVAGWGLNGRLAPRKLQFTEMVIMKNGFRECKQQMSEGKLCALGRIRGGPCPGDSGSPLVIYNPLSGPTLVGLVSNGGKSCESGLPGIFTKVQHYIHWIGLVLTMAEREYYGFVPRSEVASQTPQRPLTSRPRPTQKYPTQPVQQYPTQPVQNHPTKTHSKYPTKQHLSRHWSHRHPNHLAPRRGNPIQRFQKRRHPQPTNKF